MDITPRPASRDIVQPLPKILFWIGIVFTLLGVLAILVPMTATLAAEQVIAWLLVVWGLLGLSFGWSMRGSPAGRTFGVLFGMMLALGLIFVFFPSIGISTMSLFLVAALLLEAVFSVRYGLRLRATNTNWGWMVLSGVCALILAVIILTGWPTAGSWIIGVLLGLNFLSTGLMLIFLSRAFTF